MYMYIYIYVHTIIYPVFAACSYTYARGHPRMRMPTRLRTHARRHGAQRPASHRRPGRARPASVARRPGRKGGAYLVQPGDTRGVPRADVRVKRPRSVERLRPEPPAVHAGGRRSHVSARMRGRPVARAHTDAARARVRAIPTHGDARACPHVWAHTHSRAGGPAAHNGPRPINNPAERVPPRWRHRPGRKGRRIPRTTW